MNYTKSGEWTIRKYGITSQIWCGEYMVAEDIYNKANAHLIAASKDMYEALKGYQDTLNTLIFAHPDDKILAAKMYQVVKVLAKAEGK